MTDTQSQTETIRGTRFGEIEYSPASVIEFSAGLCGFPGFKRFVFVHLEPTSIFAWLQSVDEPCFALLMTQPQNYVEGYEVPISADVYNAIVSSDESEVLTFVTATIPPGRPKEMTLNLRGPIIINSVSKKAIQFIIDDESYTTKHRVFGHQGDASGNAA